MLSSRQALTAAPDPIFAAIEKHRRAEATHIAACKNGNEDRITGLCHRSSDALGELVATTPTTVAGCAALLRHVEAHERSYDRAPLFDGYAVEDRAHNLLSRIAATLDAVA